MTNPAFSTNRNIRADDGYQSMVSWFCHGALSFVILVAV
jgi:hypothetical protein